jgi:very-short-patch-repair endonuclease
LIPPEFKLRPFSLEEARDAGLTPRALRGKSWQRIGAELYRWAKSPEDHWLTLSAWGRILPPGAAFASASAAWLHGIDLDPTNPVEVVVPPSSGIRNRVGLKVRRSEIPPGELLSVRGLCATALPLTIATLCLQRPAVEALIAIDMAIHLSLTDADALNKFTEGAKGRHGARRMRSLVSLAAPAESPMETRLRWLLIQAGLPRPDVQTDLRIGASRFRADLYYPSARLILEFDGGHHRERMAEDNRRQNLLVNAEYRVLRFTAPDIYNRSDIVVAQVRDALRGTSGAKRTLARR